MTDEEIYNKAKQVIGEENITDYRPAIFSTAPDTMCGEIELFVPNTIMIWLENGDVIWYRANENKLT